MNEARNGDDNCAEAVPETGFVYFISDGDQVKIGYSTDPHSRLKALQTAHHRWLKLVAHFPGSYGDEGLMKKHFAKLKLRGEWFRFTTHITNAIRDLERGKSIADITSRPIAPSRKEEARVPSDPDKFKEWADNACRHWPLDLMTQAFKAWTGIKYQNERAPFDTFLERYGEWLLPNASPNPR